MTARSNSSIDYVVLAVSLGLAAVFIYAGLEKMRDPLQFADSIAGFAILPARLSISSRLVCRRSRSHAACCYYGRRADGSERWRLLYSP